MFGQLKFSIFWFSNGLIVTLSKTALQSESVVESVAESAEIRKNGMELTQEQIDILNEEPEFTTTNAMRAVYGYDPKDDQRLCAHYDPSTGACWKGNSCTFEHGPKLEGDKINSFHFDTPFTESMFFLFKFQMVGQPIA